MQRGNEQTTVRDGIVSIGAVIMLNGRPFESPMHVDGMAWFGHQHEHAWHSVTINNMQSVHLHANLKQQNSLCQCEVN